MSKSKASQKPEFTPQNFTASFELYPLIAMVRENALHLAQSLSGHSEWTDIHMSDEEWVFTRRQPRQGQPGGAVKVTVKEDEVEIEHRFPTGALERFEILVDQVTDAVQQVAKPQVLLGTNVSLEYLVALGGDARTSILGGLKLLDDEDQSDKLAVFQRPCQFVGLRLGFPAYRPLPREADNATDDENGGPSEKVADTPGESHAEPSPANEGTGEDWQATLTIQSVPDEPNQLSVEVHGRWMMASRWEDVGPIMVARVRTVDRFLRTKISAFLKHFREDEP